MEHEYIGEFEEVVLLAVGGLSRDAYAVSVHEHIVEMTGRDASLGSIYRTLSRLEKKGLVRSRMGSIRHVRGGKRKRFYELTARGSAAIHRAKDVRDRLWDALHPGTALVRS